MNRQPPQGYRLLGVGEPFPREVLALHREAPETEGWLPWVSAPGGIVAADDDFDYAVPLTETVAFPSGAKRSDATGRGRFDLIPYEAMLCLARRYEMGVPLYGERNWESGQPLSRILSSLRRHTMQINYDFSEDHLGAVLWNAAAFVTIVERMRAGILPRDLDDIGFIQKSA